MIYCLNCGKGIPDTSKFCTFCGTAIKTTDAPPVESNIPPVLSQSPNYTQQPFVKTTAPESQHVTPTPLPTPPPPQYNAPPQIPSSQLPPQYSNTTTPPIQQYATAIATTNVVRTAKNEFYKNIGFWGALLALVGFFLPYMSADDASFYYLVADKASDKPELYVYLVFPVCAAILIIQRLTGILPRFLVVIFKILPFLMLILFAIGISNNSSQFSFMGKDVQAILGAIGIGFYMTVIGTIFMLFFRTTKVKA